MGKVTGTYSQQLRQVADGLDRHLQEARAADVHAPLAAVEASARRVERSWSGSNLGYQSAVYYKDFVVPPTGHHFSSEWGFYQAVRGGSVGDWQEMVPETVEQKIRELSKVEDLEDLVRPVTSPARTEFQDAQAATVSILTAFLAFQDDDYVRSLKQQAADLVAPYAKDLREAFPSTFGMLSTRDPIAGQQGIRPAPHQDVLFRVTAHREVLIACEDLSRLARRAADHIERLTISPVSTTERQRGTRVFIGHGHSPLWRELKDFISDRLKLPYDEFNRVPVAGVTNIDRLTEMLDNAVVAFIVLTAEDEREDGVVTARQNVIHESGLFQGRLGFSRAIILLEEGCDEFSNINGLGQIRFPQGNISAKFEDIRQVLEREGLLT